MVGLEACSMTAKPSLAAELAALGGALLSVIPLVMGWGSSFGMILGGFSIYEGHAGFLLVLLAMWVFVMGPGGTLLLLLGWSAWRRDRFRLAMALIWSPVALLALPVVAMGVIARGAS